MSTCRTCGKRWPRGTSVCPDDGTRIAAAPRSDPDSGWSQEPALAIVPTMRVSDLHAGTLIGEYRIEGKLGEGGMGSVYAATHPLIGKKAAIKIISQQLCSNAAAVERFIQEARAVNQIGHPNIVDVFSFGELVDGRSYFVMEWLQGETLADRMTRGRVPLAEAVEVLDQVCDALEAAHEKQIVHRDLKPANVVLVNIRGNRQLVKLLDFGLAKLAEHEDNRLQKTRTGVMMGTPEYVSPEQARGKNVDHRTDIYALGVISYELLLGRLPFEADNAADIITKHLREAPPRPSSIWPEIPEPLESSILGMLEKDPARRPTLLEVRRVIAELRSAVGADSSLGSLRPRLVTPASGYGAALPANDSSAGAGPTLLADPHSLPGAAPSSRRWLYVAATIAGLAAAGMVAFGITDGPDPFVTPAVVENVQRPPPNVAPAIDPAAEPAPPPEIPAAVADALPSTGTVEVTTNVENATIWVDQSKHQETVPGAVVSLSAGEHRIGVTAPGKRKEERTVTVAAGAQTTETFTLKAAPPKRVDKNDSKGDKRDEKKDDKKAAGKKDDPKKGGAGSKDRDSLIRPF
jgi:eukaryotic-like serine/threonine-protein kinase